MKPFFVYSQTLTTLPLIFLFYLNKVFTFILQCIHFILYKHIFYYFIRGRLMLKKLVKYGNSNALVLDKAILELLEIAEGSLVKIKTDGKAIIITAHQSLAAQETITPIVTHNEVLKEASMEEMLKQYKHLDKTQKEQFATEFSNYQNQLAENLTATQNKLHAITEEYQSKVTTLLTETTTHRNAILQKMMDLSTTYSLIPPTKNESTLTKQQIANMQVDINLLVKKHAVDQTKLANTMNNPEYMHEMQLLSEQYVSHPKDSAEYLKATREILYKYLPEMRQADEEMAAINKKYSSAK